MIIKRASGDNLIDVIPLQSSNYSKAVMGDEMITLVFNHTAYINFKVGDYIVYEGANWSLISPNKLPSVKKLSSDLFEYNAVFYSTKYDLTKVMFFLTDGTTLPQSDFSMTGNAEMFAQLIISNLERVYGTASWALGDVISGTEYKTLTFSNEDCLTVLTRIAEEFSTEYHINNKTIHLNKISTSREVTLRYSSVVDGVEKPNIEKSTLYDLERTSVDSTDVVTRLYPSGAKTNLPANYRGGNSQLRLPASYGLHIQLNTEQLGVIEKSKIFDDVYPRLSSSGAGVITAVGDKFTFTDTAIDFDVNSCLLSGTPAKIHFNTGQCAGYDFEIKSYKHGTKTFTIIENKQDNDFTLPTDLLKPQAGDRYVILDIAMPASYIAAAESELLTRAQQYLQEFSVPKVLYKCTFSAIYAKQHTQNIQCGDTVKIIDTDLNIDTEIRIVKLQKGISDYWNMQIDLSNAVTATRIDRIENDIDELVNNIIVANKRINNNYRRGYQNTKELQDRIFDPDGYFDAENIKPLSIETGMISVGARSQTFQLSCVLQPNYEGNPQILYWTGGILTHFTISENIKEWILPAGSITIANQYSDKALYVYARCSRIDNAADIFTSDLAIKADAAADYYHFLIGVLHTPVDGVRGLSLTFGMSTINGKFIKTGRIESFNGENYTDLDNGEFRAGNTTSAFEFNVGGSGKAVLKGAIVQDAGGNESPQLLDRGTWSNTAIYYPGNYFRYGTATYSCILKTPTAGISPSNTTYFKKWVEDGAAGNDGKDTIYAVTDKDSIIISCDEYGNIKPGQDLTAKINTRVGSLPSVIETFGHTGPAGITYSVQANTDSELLITVLNSTINYGEIEVTVEAMDANQDATATIIKKIPVYKVLDGQDGLDGKSVEFIFKQTQNPTAPTTPSTAQADDYVPDLWTDNPVGVTSTWQFEWVCKRTKSNGVWSNFSAPALWSKYSFNGSNGDNGAGGASLVLSQDSVTISCNANGDPRTGQLPLDIYAYAYEAGTLRNIVDWEFTTESGLVGMSASLPSTGIVKITISSIGADTNSIRIYVQMLLSNGSTVDIEKIIPVVKAKDGYAGPSLISRGAWQPDTVYTGSHDRVDVVSITNSGVVTWYKALTTAGNFSDIQPEITVDWRNYWELMNSFDNIATGTLFAENANVAEFVFNGGKLYSQYPVNSQLDFKNLIINGVTGKIIANDAEIRGKIEALTGKIGNLDIIGNSLSNSTVKLTTDLIDSLLSLLNPSNISLSRQSSWSGSYAYTQPFTPVQDGVLEFKLQSSGAGTGYGWNWELRLYSNDDVIAHNDSQNSSTKDFQSVAITSGETYYLYAEPALKTPGSPVINLYGADSDNSILIKYYAQKTVIADQGFYSFFNLLSYLYFKQNDTFSVRQGNTELQMDTGGYAISFGGLAALRVNALGCTFEFGANYLRVSNAGFQKSSNYGETWTNF
jgi:hypothetical protein